MEMEGSIRSPTPPSTRIAVVTGANRGIGLEVCRQLAGNGLTVVLTARDETRGLAAVEKLNEAGFSDVVFHQLEITDAKSIARLADFLKTRFGKLDILVNNAAVGAVEYVQDPIDSSPSSDQKFSGMDELQRLKWMFQNVRETCDSAKEGVQTNYYGTKHVIQALLPLLKTSSDGRIVNVSSGFGLLRAAARWVLFVTQREPRILCRHGDCPGRGPPTPWMDALWSSRPGNLATHRLMHARRSRSRVAGAGDERLGPSDGSSDGRTRRPSRQGRDATSAGRRRPRDGAKVLGAAVAADFSQKSRRRGDEARAEREGGGRDRIAVVTGANRGIGLEVCQQLAVNGITVVLTAMDEGMGAAAVKKLKGLAFSDVLFHQLDITDVSSIARLANFLNTRFGKLDILVNNAAVGGVVYSQDPVDDLESREEKFNLMDRDQRLEWLWRNCRETYDAAKEGLQTNYYGTKHVIEALLPLLKASDDGRIVNVSSDFGLLRHFRNEDLKQEVNDVSKLTEERLDELLDQFLRDFKAGTAEARGWPVAFAAYKVSKAAVNAYSRILAAKQPALRVNCAHPGYVKSDITLHSGLLTPEEGASNVVKVALLPDGGVTGAFFEEGKELASFV